MNSFDYSRGYLGCIKLDMLPGSYQWKIVYASVSHACTNYEFQKPLYPALGRFNLCEVTS